MTRCICLAFLLVLAACAQPEVPALDAPLELDIATDMSPVCDPNDDDGIGGTGCEPVARHAYQPAAIRGTLPDVTR